MMLTNNRITNYFKIILIIIFSSLQKSTIGMGETGLNLNEPPILNLPDLNELPPIENDNQRVNAVAPQRQQQSSSPKPTQKTKSFLLQPGGALKPVRRYSRKKERINLHLDKNGECETHIKGCPHWDNLNKEEKRIHSNRVNNRRRRLSENVRKKDSKNAREWYASLVKEPKIKKDYNKARGQREIFLGRRKGIMKFDHFSTNLNLPKE